MNSKHTLGPNMVHCTFIVDMIAQLRCLNNLPVTYKEQIRRFLCSFPQVYKRVEIIADTEGAKCDERNNRGIAS